VLWVQKIREGGEHGRYQTFIVLDAEARTLAGPLPSVTEDEAAALVASGAWRYVR
jgi:hypothetical protein